MPRIPRYCDRCGHIFDGAGNIHLENSSTATVSGSRMTCPRCEIVELPLEETKTLMTPDNSVMQRAREFIQQEMQSGFIRYSGVAPLIDEMHAKVFIPQLRHKYALALGAFSTPYSAPAALDSVGG